MENKKSPEADLERHRSTWLLAGYTVALSVLFVALEWSVPEPETDTMTALRDLLFEEELDIQLPEQMFEAPPQVPTAKTPAPPPTLTLVDNDVRVEETPPPLASETTEQLPTPDVPTRPAHNAPTKPAEAFLVVDELPEFPYGGLSGLMRYLTQHIRYPLMAQKNRIQGRVLCQFIVNADGSIADVEVMEGIHPSLDQEARRVLAAMPRWKPGKLRGKSIPVRFTLPVEFRLR